MRAPTPEAVDAYLNMGLTKQGERSWTESELANTDPAFRPLAMRVRNPHGQVVDTVLAAEGFTIEMEYELKQAISGLRVGIYLMTTRGEYVLTSFDTDSPALFETYTSRPAGRYISRVQIPANLLNEGRYVLGVNASSYRIKRYFQDDKALTFTVDATGAPGMHWPEKRLGPVRPELVWKIDTVE
jgi:lipopolysaccharide transport system ATP-binding protein